MARLHEEYLAELFGGRKTRGSGSQWQDPADGRNNRLTEPEFAFAWDGKSTAGLGITIDLKMIAKIREQAGGERPALGLRWYGTEDLQRVTEDWVAITAADFAELLAGARLAVTAEQSLNEAARISAEALRPGPPPPQLRGPYPDDLPPPSAVMWPCLIVDGRHEPPGGVTLVTRGYYVSGEGIVTDYPVSSVRYDTGMGEMRLYVNDVRVLCGQLYIDGVLRMTVGAPAVHST